MQQQFKRWLSGRFDSTPESNSLLSEFPDEVVAACVLCLEVSLADHEESPVEIQRLSQAIQRGFGLTEEAVNRLIVTARRVRQDTVSLFDHTRVLNDTLDHATKVALVQHLWTVAFADGEIDHYEEHLIRRVSDLLYLDHAEFIRAKLGARALSH